MATHWLRPLWLLCAPTAALALALLPGVNARGESASDDLKLPAALLKQMPESLEDLQAIEAHMEMIVAKVMPAVVNVKSSGGGGQGSGVVITEDGYVLTAAHVIPQADSNYILTFPNGKQVKAKPLGVDRTGDSGLLKIVEEGKYPFCEMGKSGELKKTQWCFALGHPGGLKQGRNPPVRLGRIISSASEKDRWVTTECTLVGGDSGGPLFDMYGKVIGIHSRIGNPLTANMHVPVDIYRNDWEKLAKGERWGTANGGGKGGPQKQPPGQPGTLGAASDLDYRGPGIKIANIASGSAAEKAGLKVNDIITSISAKTVATTDELRAELQKRRAGDEVILEVRRGTETLKLKALLDKAVQ
jgi:serine protease Do